MPETAEQTNGKPTPARIPRTREVLSAGVFFARAIGGYQALTREMADVERSYGPTLWAAMMNDPAVGSSVDMIRQRSVCEPELWPPEELVADPGEDPTPEETLAEEITAFCRRALCNPTRPLIESLNEWTYGLVEDKLAEVVLEKVTAGPDAGRLTLGAFKFKPRECWEWVVDGAGNADFIAGKATDYPDAAQVEPAALAGASGDMILLESDRFAVFCWGARDSDPRTRPIIRRAYNAWNMKIRTWPEKLKGDSQFGTPSTVAIMPEAVDDPDADQFTGVTLPDGSEITTAEAAVLYQLIQLSNGTAAVLPFGTKVEVVESKRQSSNLDSSINLYNREIQAAILQTPATVQSEEGKSNQRADLVPEHLVRMVRGMLCGLLRNVLRTLVRLNWGEDAARRMVPMVSMDDVDVENQSEMIGAWSQWVMAAGATERQMAAICDKLGLPPKESGDAIAVQPKANEKAGANGGTDEV